MTECTRCATCGHWCCERSRASRECPHCGDGLGSETGWMGGLMSRYGYGPWMKGEIVPTREEKLQMMVAFGLVRPRPLPVERDDG